MLKIWTDGSCLGNPGPGGWGFVATDGVNIAERNGGEKDTTNNRMELMAVIRALTAANKHDELEIHTMNGNVIRLKEENKKINVIDNGEKLTYAVCKLDWIRLGAAL